LGLLEVTSESLRLRKRVLDTHVRGRQDQLTLEALSASDSSACWRRVDLT